MGVCVCVCDLCSLCVCVFSLCECVFFVCAWSLCVSVFSLGATYFLGQQQQFSSEIEQPFGIYFLTITEESNEISTIKIIKK